MFDGLHIPVSIRYVNSAFATRNFLVLAVETLVLPVVPSFKYDAKRYAVLNQVAVMAWLDLETQKAVCSVTNQVSLCGLIYETSKLIVLPTLFLFDYRVCRRRKFPDKLKLYKKISSYDRCRNIGDAKCPFEWPS